MPNPSSKGDALAERFVRTIRCELLDLVLVLGRRHLLGLLRDYEAYYNSHRPHRGIAFNAPEKLNVDARVVSLDEIRRTANVGGLINEYGGRRHEPGSDFPTPEACSNPSLHETASTTGPLAASGCRTRSGGVTTSPSPENSPNVVPVRSLTRVRSRVVSHHS